jgi:ATP-binding cassette, subfamily B, bacterial
MSRLALDVAAWTGAGGRILARRVALLRLLRSGPRGLVAAYVATSLLAGLIPTVSIVASGVLAQRVADAVADDTGTGPVERAFVVVVALFLAGELLALVHGQLAWRLTKRIDEQVRERAMAAALAGADLARLHDPDVLAAMRKVRGLADEWVTPGNGASGLVDLGRMYLGGVANTAVMAWYSPPIAFVTFVVALIQRYRWRRVVQRFVDASDASETSFAEWRYLVDLGLGRPAAAEIRLFGLAPWIGGRIRRAGATAWAPMQRARRKGVAPETVVQFLLVGGAATLALVWAARAATDGALSTGGLVVFVTTTFFVVYQLGVASGQDAVVARGADAMPALELLERRAAEVVRDERGRRAAAADAPPAIELRDVWFRYPGADEDVLRGVTLSIPAGASVSLIGTNGAGKTTLIRLVCGLYRPQRGTVLVDGVDVAELDLAAWHRRIASMYQDFLRLAGTVAENVAAGAGADGHEAVRAAAGEAGVLRFTDRLPKGLETVVAASEADGHGLSGGEWQRIAIARALLALHAGAGLLLLDEPTSNLDTASEERLVRRLIEDTRGSATAVLVTHRLALARRTDRIYVIDAGRVAEEGTHDELVAAGGRYADAFGMQAALYPLEAGGG